MTADDNTTGARLTFRVVTPLLPPDGPCERHGRLGSCPICPLLDAADAARQHTPR